MHIIWDAQSQFHLTPSFVGRIKTGQSQNVRNWYTALKLRKRLDIWGQAWTRLLDIATSGKDVQAGIPEVETFEVEGKQLAVVFGVMQKGITPGGRVEGAYKFVLCDQSEVLEVLGKEFKFKERLKWKSA